MRVGLRPIDRRFKVEFTAWSKLTAVDNHLVGKSVFGLVVTHIGFAHIRRLKVVSTLIGGFKVFLTAWLNLTAVKNRLVGNTISSLVVTHIGFVHIRPLKVVLTLIGG